MIVADANLVAYAYTPSPYADEVEELGLLDPIWVTVELCRSEFRNLLAAYLRRQWLTLEQINWILEQKERRFEFGYYEVNSAEVMALVATSRCSAYDCEYVALAKKFDVPLITYDRQLLTSFPEIARTTVHHLTAIRK